MMGLVDYGSDSGSGSDDSGDEGVPSGILVPNPSKGISAPVAATKPEKSMTASLEDAGFFGDEADEDDEEGSKLSLPAARSTHRPSGEVNEEDIEDIAKPKEWEKKLADKARRKLEKKSLKKAEKDKRREEKRLKKEGKTEQKEEPKKKKRGPVKIDAFGGLSKASVEVEEERSEDKSISASIPSSTSSSLKLFSMLPAPKTASRLAPSSKAASLMLPPSLRTKAVEKPPAPVVKQPVKSLVSGVDSSDDEEGDNDFFGLSSTNQSNVIPTTISHVPGVPLLPSYGLSDEAGPVRPDPMDSSYGYEGAEDEEADEGPSSSAQMKTISDEAAQNMIFKYDYAPFGHDRRGFNEADIIDVSVDRAIGPNVQENLLKNLNRNNMARASMPSLPTANAPNDKNAKRKHQITYLANIAVAREGELQQKWAEGKAAKRMARQKYGF